MSEGRPRFAVLQGSPTHGDMAGEMAERITDVIYSYADRVPLALAIGVLRIVEAEVLKDNQ